ncbi:Tyrosine-protein phosphatase SIW14 [Hondaea fermentalgiana]|uniref:Tyrosine-protein phosphatase SIW14 n=1 Tax=Hondaea fermentalgiana TaxID=2315210 RepID=A0A2R5GQP3_9STRA|nr:Tyrosine-protein phosphatase SIW14 [Hondaea fermentalgiana]|eukprot:GBG32078.1 Tyrosine-protein phosphatase SIW14 [Hondaea fermentalgiana]
METLHAPERFGTVEAGVYRSSVLQPVNFQFVCGLGLKTIVHLSPEVTLRAVSKFISEQNIKLLHLGLKFWRPSGWSLISEDLVKEALEVVLDERNHPLLIMCTSGVHLTGTVIGCLRRLQQRSFTNIMDELRCFAHPTHTRYANETFIEFFDVDLVSLPGQLPSWFSHASEVSHRKFAPLARPRRPTSSSIATSTDGDDETYAQPERLPAYQRYFFDLTGPLVEAWYKDALKESKVSEKLLAPLPPREPSKSDADANAIEETLPPPSIDAEPKAGLTRTEAPSKEVKDKGAAEGGGEGGVDHDEDEEEEDDDDEEEDAIEVEVENDVLVIRFARRSI